MVIIIRSGDSLLKTIIEGRVDGRRTRGRTRQILLGWMTDKKLSTNRIDVFGHLNLPQGRESEEDH